MATECTIHDMILTGSTLHDYGAIGTFLKNFGPLIVSTLSLGLAWSVSRITKNQKEINRKSYNLNLFKERFALWKKFNDKKYAYSAKFGDLFRIETPREHGIDLEEILDRALSDQSYEEEISKILKEIKFLFRDPENKFRDVIKSIEYNTNISYNHGKYKDIFIRCKTLKEIILINQENYDEKFAELFRKIIMTYDFIDNELLFISNFSELKNFYTTFIKKHRSVCDLKHSISQKEEEIYSIQQNKNYSHDDDSNIIKIKKEIQQNKESIDEIEKELNNLKKINRHLVEQINNIEVKIRIKSDEYEKELKLIYHNSNMKGEFFDRVNNMMEYYLDVDK
ncbi:hypothetical protein NQF87_00165 [Bombella sp. TMW 2.2559]|uniref:Uncharacterized protein n=1 Tax=Bombella dulcis TaxID=2967339 RepID=A0ABT3W8K3_9PROT|nr:hypothetical protein [Bombella dulcis]MCX5615399.1 hypothetical protein [Bombella dulcis]